MPIAQLKKANDALLNEDLVMAIPYDGRFRFECDFRSAFSDELLIFGHLILIQETFV